jgi:integrase
VTHELHLPGASKNNEPVDLPVLPPLQAAIDALPADNLTFIVREDGKPLTKESFGNWFHDCCLEAGLLPKVVDVSGRPKGLSAHGLRKRMGAMLANLGCSDREIMAVLGDTDPRMASAYTTGANKKRMAWSALTKRLEAEQPGTPDLHTPGTALHTIPKRIGNERK